MCENSLFLHGAARFCAARFRENRLPFLSAFAVGLLCYLYAFTNKLLNHDEVQSLFLKGGTVTSGRWGLGALDTVFPNYSMPWIYGIMAVFFLAVACCLVVRILDIRSGCLQVLLSGSILAFPSLIGTFGYMFTSNSFALAFLLAVFSVWCLRREGLFPTVLALGCMVFSLSIYQSYISVAAGLLVVAVIRDTLAEEALPRVIRRGIGYVLFLAASLGLYYGATQVVFRLTHVTFNEYAADNIGFSIAGIPAAMVQAYTSFFRFFAEGYQGLIPTGFGRALHLLGLLCTGALAAGWCVRSREIGRIALLLAMLLVLPLAINCMYLFTTADSVHTLVLYGFVSLYALWAVVLENAPETSRSQKILSLVCGNLITLVLTLTVICNVYLANQAWLNLHLRYENAYAFYTTLISDIRQQPQFQPGTRLAVIGDYQEPVFYEEQFSQLKQITGVKGFLPDSYSKERFLQYYLGFGIPFAGADEVLALEQLPQVQEMPAYPYYGSVITVGDVIVVKLS